MTTAANTQQTTPITAVTLEVTDLDAATRFYADAFGLGDQLRLRASDSPSTGFRGFTLSLVVSQPADVDALVDAAIEAGATVLKPVAKSFWGYGGSVQAPDGTVWKIASSSKKNTGPATKQVDDFVLLLGVADVKATKQFYVEQGLAVSRSFGSKYVEFEAPAGQLKLALYTRRAAAKDAGIDPEGTGSHRVVVNSTVVSGADPDGFPWEAAV
ncbi:glyoxalase [Nocardioides speluncae]|uniref:glyoxalase n=1 Tax=Nocardioides speluncae TaxID=2670337 RepID=UPI000D686750|nr:glyoxalase [Nocardioides speluncae]